MRRPCAPGFARPGGELFPKRLVESPQMTFNAGAIRGIIFDLDGTLVDSYEAIAESLNSALSGMSRATLPVDQVRTMVGRGLETLIERGLGGPPGASPEAIAQGVRLFRERYNLICVDKTRLLPDVARVLPELHARGYVMGVATNKPSYFARRLLDAMGVGDLLMAVLGPDLVEHPKPHPAMLLAVLESMKLEPSAALYVGDMEIDVETARAAGLPVVVMPTGSRPLEELQSAGADQVLPDFGSLLELLPGPERAPSTARVSE